MINSPYAPNYKPKIGQSKAYYQILTKPSSDEYIKFIQIYKFLRNNINERERNLLDFVYGVNCEVVPSPKIGKMMRLSSGRIYQIRNNAERQLANQVLAILHGPRKRSFTSIISSESEDVLISIGKATCPWEPIIKHYFEESKPRYYKKRKELIEVLYTIWRLDMLNHREQAIRILKINKEDIIWD